MQTNKELVKETRGLKRYKQNGSNEYKKNKMKLEETPRSNGHVLISKAKK